MPSVPTPPSNVGWTLSASVNVAQGVGRSRIIYYRWTKSSVKRPDHLRIAFDTPRVSTIEGALDSLIDLLQAYRRSLER